MKRKIAVLGSTGSIGRQALDVIAAHSDEFELAAVSFGSNIREAEAQLARFSPRITGVLTPELSGIIAPYVKTVFSGDDAAARVAAESDADIVLNAVSGFAGTVPLIAALNAGKTVALANKESIVCAYPLIIDALSQGRIIPVDSEQSALFQCLKCGQKSEVSKLILTASGGPFFGKKRNELKDVTLDSALNHPVWSMGKGISLDSATMFNKGLEIIEAARLFGFDGDRIRVVIHPQSVVHSMVEYVDGQVIAQLGVPDMRSAIQYALSYPERIGRTVPELDLTRVRSLEFFEPDDDTFPALRLAYAALAAGGTMPVVFNASKEAASERFMRGMTGFNDISDCVEAVMDKTIYIDVSSVEDILAADAAARKAAAEFFVKAKV